MDPDPILNASDILGEDKKPSDDVIKNYLQPFF